MSYRLTGAMKSYSYKKAMNVKRVLCSVCLCYRSSNLFLTHYCCSVLTKHTKRQVCDSCVHQHVISKLYSCLTSSVTCPELNCHVNLSQSAICDILIKYESSGLLNDYLLEQQWQGKSDEWIKRFAARCPGCNVPIEKNGGCDEMICTLCQTHFYWSKTRRFGEPSKMYQEQSLITVQPFIVGIALVVFLLFLILSTVMYFNK